jgi:hydroxymethylglutaryl-CoA reductase (NADPH)
LLRSKPWPHRNGPEDIALRQETVRLTPGWDEGDEVALRLPEDPRVRTVLGSVQECLTGQVTLPVALVGPMAVQLGTYALDGAGNLVEEGRAADLVYVPLAHTEGGLSASMHRGALATRAEGIRTFVLADRMTRASCFQFRDTTEALAFARWVEARVAEMRAWLQDPANPLAGQRSAQGVRLLSRHARLWEVRTHVLGGSCHVLFRFTTGDACGPNMMTRNAYALNHWFIKPRFEQETGIAIRRIVLEANMGGDKKPSYQYFHEGHGKTVLAEAFVSGRALRRFLHCSADDIVALQQIGLHGSHASGMQSAGFTPASAIAAIFAATGQDLGMVGTSSMAHAGAELQDGGVRFWLRLPGLEVGTVGGGTVLPYARAWLKVLRCDGPGSVYRFAQIVAAATLCLEISAAASMATGGSENFYRAHLERGAARVRDWLEGADGGRSALSALRPGSRP